MKTIAMLCGLMALTSALADSAFVDFSTKMVFPQKLGGLPFDRVEKYDNEAFGYSVFYAQGTFQAELTVCTLGKTDIPDGPEGDAVTLAFQSAESLLKKSQANGNISKLRKRGGSVIPNRGDIRFANTIFQYDQPRITAGVSNSVPRILSVYLTGSKSNLIKLDLQFDMQESKRASDLSKEMLKQLIGILSAQPDDDALLMAACDALLLDPASYAGRTAAQYVLAKAQTMDDLNIYTHLFVWPDGYQKPKTADLLVAAYFAGMLQVVVPQKLESGGEFEAFVAMLNSYGVMRAKDEITSIPEFDEWAKASDKNALYEQLLYTEVEE
ncbi:hypothetical protein [Pontiella sulfatireligans]|uniref:Uncharacterized protein n=1 Tax=Pontiella sulfatireligans TaxID=2750658 RepID=A0A6C2UJ61_9BACT|nr:hypothetical protein [Pontiella sulfatireligans]VGO20262.1 hypothetical protein SCARR_02323 [Pontiella sulfatireligans]